MPRLFTALELPDRLKEGLQRLRMPLPGAKWVEPDDYHLTLRFFGDIDNRIAGELADFLAGIHMHAFELRLAGLGAFGGNDPKSIWVGLDATGDVEALARAHERAARNAGLPPERRAFKPHVTLARLRSSDPARVARFLERHGAFRSEPFTIRRFVLMSSRPQVGGGPYVVEEAYPLGVGGDEMEEEYRW